MPKHSDELRLALVRALSESRRVLTGMGISDARLKISYLMMSDRRPWPIYALAEAAGIHRITVREVLRDQVERGWVVRAPKGHQLTESGVERFRARADSFIQEFMEPMLEFNRILAREYPDFKV